jgi:S-layer protein
MAVDTSRLQKFYIAYYGRPADPEGLAYWATVLENNLKGNEILLGAAFGNAAQAEFAAIYGSSTGSATAFINKVYNNLFGRNVDSAGLAYWQGVYNTKVVVDGKDPAAVRAEMVMYILDGAQGADATIVANKTTAAVSFTAELDTADEQVAFVNAVLAAPGANAGTTTLAAVGATTTADEITALVTSGITQATDQAAAAEINEIALSASATVRTFTGTAGKDKFVATLGDSLKDGDKIVGSLESDTLALRSNGNNTDGNILTTMDGVETVEINLRSATTIDTAQWSGVASIGITGLSAGAALTLTNVKSTAVDFDMAKAANLTVSYEDNTGTDTIDLRLGSGISNTATFNGNNEIVNITVSGVATLTLDASAETINVLGSGNLTLDMGGDAISGINAASLNGSITATISAGTNVTFVGGSTGDTLNFNNTLTSGDVMNGGAGTDTLNMLSLSSASTVANVTPTFTGVTNFEILNVNASGVNTGTLIIQNPRFDTISITGTTATTQVSFSGLANTAIIIDAASATSYNFAYTGTDAIDVGSIAFTTAGPATVTSVAASGADSLTLGMIGATAGTITLTTVTVGNGTENIALTAGASGDLTVSTLLVTGAITSLAFRASGNADLVVTTVDSKLNDSFDRLTVDQLIVNAAGVSARVDVGTFSLFESGLDAIQITGGNSADIVLGPITIDAGSVVDLDVTLTADAQLGSAGADGFAVTMTTSGTLSYTVVAASGSVVASAIDAGTLGQLTDLSITLTGSGASFAGPAAGVNAGEVGTVTLSAGLDSTIALGGLTASKNVGQITLTDTSSGSVSTGAITACGVAGVTINAGPTSVVSVGTITAGKAVGQVAGTMAKDAELTLSTIAASGTTTVTGLGGISITAGASAHITLGSAAIQGSSAGVGIGLISIEGGANNTIIVGELSADGSLAGLSVVVGSSSTIGVSAMDSQSADIGNITLSVGTSGSVSFDGALADEGDIGNITLRGGSSLTVGAILASGSIGNIDIIAGSSEFTGEVEASGIGNINIQAHGFTLEVTAGPAAGTFSIGDVVIAGSAIDLDIGSAAGAATIRSITISGSGANSVDTGSAAAVTNGITFNGSGAVTLNLSSNAAAVTVDMNASASTIYLSDKGDTIELVAGTGKDNLYLDQGATLSLTNYNADGRSAVHIVNFQFSANSVTDNLYVGATAGAFGLVSANDGAGSFHSASDALSVVMVTAVNTDLVIADAGSSNATDVIWLATSIDAGSIASALAWLGNNGVTAANDGASLATAGNVFVLWYNNSAQETQLHLVGTTATWAETFSAGNTDVGMVASFAENVTLYSGSMADTFYLG